MTGLDALDRSIHKTNDWLNDVARELSLDDRHLALSGLRSTLHVLRDRIPAEQSAHLAAQLPIVVRGLFYEGYRPSDVPKKMRTKEEFTEEVRGQLTNRPELSGRPEEVIRAALIALQRHVTGGEVAKVRESLPEDIRSLWPESGASA